MTFSIVLFYLALALWIPVFVWSLRRRKWLPFFVYGMAFTVFLNGRYVVEGLESGIMFFTGIFDVVAHIGVSEGEQAAILTTCEGNACTVLSNYDTHPSWTVAFYERFTQGDNWRATLLYGHIIFNTIALVTATIQLFRPGGQFTGHKAVGRVSVLALLISLTCAGWLTSELSDVTAYGHWWTTIGLYFLALNALVPAGIGVAMILRGRAEAHRIWMWRYVGAIWGSYWIFRAEMMLVDLFVKDTEGLTLTVPSWTAGLIGIALAEYIRRRLDRRTREGDRSVLVATAAE